jgi:hypothetical protein
MDMKASIRTSMAAITRMKPMKYSETELMQEGFTPAPVSGLALEAQSALSEWTLVMRKIPAAATTRLSPMVILLITTST